VSAGGNALYAVNSDWDLQWNGGTLQSYDLFRLRHDVNRLILANLAVPGVTDPSPQCGPQNSASDRSDIDASVPCIPVFDTAWTPADCNASSLDASAVVNSNGTRNFLGQTCSPPVNSTAYQRTSSQLGAFATELKLSQTPTGDQRRRLFMPVGGNTSITWGDVPNDSPASVPADDVAAQPLPAGVTTFAPNDVMSSPYAIDCGGGVDGTCSSANQAGNFVDPSDTRNVTIPGEPYAIALTLDESAIAVTQQTSNQASLLLSGIGLGEDAGIPSPPPSMQYVLTGVPSGGDGIAAIPHDDSPDSPAPGCEFFPLAEKPPPTCVRPAFLETNHTTAQIQLLRYYNDYYGGSSLVRPYLEAEVQYPLSAIQQVGQVVTDARGIVIDPTPRMLCRYAVATASVQRTAPAPDLHGSAALATTVSSGEPADPCLTDPSSAACAQWIACGATPSRVFLASRTPPGLVIGHIGGPSASGDGSFDPDRLTLNAVVPLSIGVSTVYLAPIVNRIGQYELRVFVVCFDSNQIYVYNPAYADSANPQEGVENVIYVGQGPQAMAFDPFDLHDVARNAPVPPDLRQADSLHLKTYRFAYVGLFTQSFVQVIDLDDSLPDVSPRTFEAVVFSLGQPTQPKGT
jgi:hypothetical protein